MYLNSPMIDQLGTNLARITLNIAKKVLANYFFTVLNLEEYKELHTLCSGMLLFLRFINVFMIYFLETYSKSLSSSIFSA